MKCPNCLDIELCDDCEVNACPLCCPNENCPNNFAYQEKEECDRLISPEKEEKEI